MIPNNSDVTYFVINAAKQSVKTVGVTDAANATSMCVIDARHYLSQLHPNCTSEHALIRVASSAKVQPQCFPISAMSVPLVSLRNVCL